MSQPSTARFVKPEGHLAGRAEVRPELDRHRHRHGHGGLDPAQDVDVPLLDVPPVMRGSPGMQ
jgi:hypothetical protein